MVFYITDSELPTIYSLLDLVGQSIGEPGAQLTIRSIRTRINGLID